MKAVSLALLLSLPGALCAAEVRLGADLNEVHAVMEGCHGQLRVGDRLLLYYDRGEIELHAGIVTRVALVPIDAYLVLQTKRAATAARIREEQEARRVQLSAEGEKLMARKLADPMFRSASPAYQVAFWEGFAHRYPDVPCAEQLASARLSYSEQLEVKLAIAEQAARLAELENRIRETEARVAQAEAGGYGGRYYTNYGYTARRPFNLWPVEYHYFDKLQSPVASPGIFNRPNNFRNNVSTNNHAVIGHPVSENPDFGKQGNAAGRGLTGSIGRCRL